MRKDFVTARNHIKMTWNPQGYWTSPPGAFIGNGSYNEVCASFTQTELSRGKIPAGYSFSVNGASQFVVSNGSINRGGAVPPPAPALAPAPVVATAPTPVVKPAPRIVDTPTPAPESATTRRSFFGFGSKSKPETEATPAPVPAAMPVPLPVSKPVSIAAAPPPPKPVAPPPSRGAVLYSASVPNPKPPPGPGSRSASAPAARTQPTPAMRAAVLDPITAAPAASAPGAAAASSAPVGPSINGIPADMQKSFLSRHKPVFMMFDKDSGKWKSSEGAIKDLTTADEWCQQATAIDRRWGRIPGSFSYKHVGNGQVEATKD